MYNAIKEKTVNGHTISLLKSHPYFSPGFDVYDNGDRIYLGDREGAEKAFKKAITNYLKN